MTASQGTHHHHVAACVTKGQSHTVVSPPPFLFLLVLVSSPEPTNMQHSCFCWPALVVQQVVVGIIAFSSSAESATKSATESATESTTKSTTESIVVIQCWGKICMLSKHAAC